MPDFMMFNVGSLEFARVDPHAFTNSLRRLALNARAETEDLADLRSEHSALMKGAMESRGSIPRNKWVKTSSFKKQIRGAKALMPRINTLTGYEDAQCARMQLVQALTAWTRNPHTERLYRDVLVRLPGAGDSELAKVARSIMLDDDVPFLTCGSGSGCWIFDMSAARRQIAETALQDAQTMATQILKLLNESAMFMDKEINDYFGPGTSGDDGRMQTIIQNFTAIHANLAGAHKHRLCVAPPAGYFPQLGTRTVACVAADRYPATDGPVVFLNDPFFEGTRSAEDRAGTIVHEVSHYFAATLDADERGTERGCYGDANCRRMALLNTPASNAATIRNADTYSHFAIEAIKENGFLL